MEVHPHSSLQALHSEVHLQLFMSRLLLQGASLGSPPLALYEPFVVTRCFTRKSTLGSLRAIHRYWCFTWKSTVVLGTSLGSTCTDPWLSTSHIRRCRRKNLSRKCSILKHSTSYGQCIRHSSSGAFMAFPEPIIEVKRMHRSIIAYLICLIEHIKAPAKTIVHI